MAKIIINGEPYDYDSQKQPISEAMDIEDVYGARFAQWQDDLAGGSAKAMRALAWVIWRRDGRDIPYEKVGRGDYDFDLNEMFQSIIDAAVERRAEDEAAAADPPVSADPAGTDGTATGTSPSSRKNTGSARGKSAG